MEETITCDCGHTVTRKNNDIGMGYGQDTEGKKYCYKCCAIRDTASMLESGKGVMYLIKKDDRYLLTNWPGTLNILADHVKRGRHNMARYRYDVWFKGVDGKRWHGIQIGDNTQICRVHRLKH